MKKVTLRFTDSISLADFILNHQIRGAEVYSCAQSLEAVLSEKELKAALKDYGAEFKRAEATEDGRPSL